MARLTLRHRVARLHPFVWVAAVAIAGGLVAWPLGGWETVELESTKVPDVAPGTLVEGRQFSVQVDDAGITDVHPDGFSEPEPGWEYLVMSMTVITMTVETELSLSIGDGFFGIVTVDDGVVGFGTTNLDSTGYEVSGDAFLVADGTSLPDLQPRLAAPLRMVWEVPTGTWSEGDTITVGVVDRTPYEQTLSTGTGYSRPTVIATIDLTLESL